MMGMCLCGWGGVGTGRLHTDARGFGYGTHRYMDGRRLICMYVSTDRVPLEEGAVGVAEEEKGDATDQGQVQDGQVRGLLPVRIAHRLSWYVGVYEGG